MKTFWLMGFCTKLLLVQNLWVLSLIKWIKNLVLFGSEKNNSIFDSIRYLIGLQSSTTYVHYHNYAKIKIDSDDDLSLQKIYKTFLYLLSQFLVKVTISITIKNVRKNTRKMFV